ncbi:MAG: FTR1 family protein [Promethearchaeota archaeon]
MAFREGLEAVLVIVIIVLYLKNSKQTQYYKYVSLGGFLAISASILFAVLFNILFGGFSGIVEEIFEGFTFIISGVFIITLILWMSKEGPKLKQSIEMKIEESIETRKLLSITGLIFIIILREGIELVLLLTGATSVGSLGQGEVIIGSLIGLSIATLIGLLTFYGIKSINITKFFKITNVILILFAAGLITYGIHELIEAGLINPIIPEVWNIKSILPESFPDGNPLTPEFLEIIGSIMKTLFGYNANPSLLEVVVYPALIILISMISLLLWRKSNKATLNKENLESKLKVKEIIA